MFDGCPVVDTGIIISVEIAASEQIGWGHSTTLKESIYWEAGLHKTGIRGIQDTRQIVDRKTNDKRNDINKHKICA